MKKFFLYSMVICGAILTGCNKEKDPVDPSEGRVQLWDGADGTVWINNSPDVNITGKNETLPTSETLKASYDGDLRVNEYTFKLVAEAGRLRITSNNTNYDTQATHVKISDDGFAFVSYNLRGNPNIGGLVVYKYDITDASKGQISVSAVTSIEMPNAQINSVDFDNNKLYLAGANNEPKLGYKGDSDAAFFMVMELDPATKRFKQQEPFVKQLTSFQATSIRKYQNRVYITVGDGTNSTKGGLYIFNANDLSQVKFLGSDESIVHARGVDVDNNNVYLYQANHARVTKYGADGVGGEKIYDVTGEAMQTNAKSEIFAWKDYLFISQNETGLRMLYKGPKVVDGELVIVNDFIDAPNKSAGDGWDDETDVTNSVNMNSDPKIAKSGAKVQTDLLLVANGQQGLYWYEIVKDMTGKDRIAACPANSVLKDDNNSANFVTSKENIVFVANGLGGLKILWMDLNDDEDKWDCSGEGVFEGFNTWLKDNGGGNDLWKRKVGDVLFAAEEGNFVIYMYSGYVPEGFTFIDEDGIERKNQKTIDLKSAGVAFGTSLQYFDDLELLSGGPALENKNIVNGAMKDYNKAYRTLIPGGVKFTFPKSYFETNFPDAFENGQLNLMVIAYSGNGAWAYGEPQGPSGSTGTGVNNNGQILNLKGVGFCAEK